MGGWGGGGRMGIWREGEQKGEGGERKEKVMEEEKGKTITNGTEREGEQVGRSAGGRKE